MRIRNGGVKCLFEVQKKAIFSRKLFYIHYVLYRRSLQSGLRIKKNKYISPVTLHTQQGTLIETLTHFLLHNMSGCLLVCGCVPFPFTFPPQFPSALRKIRVDTVNPFH